MIGHRMTFQQFDAPVSAKPSKYLTNPSPDSVVKLFFVEILFILKSTLPLLIAVGFDKVELTIPGLEKKKIAAYIVSIVIVLTKKPTWEFSLIYIFCCH
jgi:hypothetical protein